LAPGETAKQRAAAWITAKKVPTDDEDRFMKDITVIGKGRYAQRLAATLKKKLLSDRTPASRSVQAPPYISEAIVYLADKVRVR
jgi:hypothetical protein